jgi:hypothetical protein
MSACSNIISQLQNIHSLREQLNQKVADFSDAQDGLEREGKVKALNNIFGVRKTIKQNIEIARNEFYTPVISTSTFVKGDDDVIHEFPVEINFDEMLQQNIRCYTENNIRLSKDFIKKAKEIWTKNKTEIELQMATYDYNFVLIIPDNLPSIADLHAMATAGCPPTSVDNEFRDSGLFAGAINSKSRENKFRLVLVHNRSIMTSHVLSSTINWSIKSMTDLSVDEVRKVISNRGDFSINFTSDYHQFGPDRNVNSYIKAEGLSLSEYLLLQMLHERSAYQHLDEGTVATLLPATFAGDKLIACQWKKNGELQIRTIDPTVNSSNDHGCRLCRVFT